MQKHILLAYNIVKKHINRLLLTLVLMSVMPVYAASGVITLLTAQCVDYTDTFKPNFKRTIDLERQMLGLYNLNDRVNYYRMFNLRADDSELLLQCQLKLADALDSLVSHPELERFIAKTNADSHPQQKALSQRLNWLEKNHLDIQNKAKLNTFKASIKQGLKSNQLTLSLGECKLPEQTQSTQEAGSFAVNIASYLMKQTDPACREKVWQAYQGRAKIRNQIALSSIKALRKQQAAALGVTSYSELILQDQILNTPELVADFLATQTQKLSIAPWDIGQALKSAEAMELPTQDASVVLAQLLQQLSTLDIRFEQIDKNWIRLYHQQHFLGDIHLVEGKTNQHRLLRRSVTGHQAGQSELQLKNKFSRLSDYKSAIKALSQSVLNLAAGGKYYLNNAIKIPKDSAQLGEYWLENYLIAGFPTSLTPMNNSREAIIEHYQKQLQVFRAKVALAEYQPMAKSVYPKLNEAFEASFSGQWQATSNYAYSFTALVEIGPLFYRELWQRQLIKLINQQTHYCRSSSLFKLLVVNEHALNTHQQLALIFKDSSALSLINRINYAKNQTSPTFDACPLSASSN